MRGCIGCDAGFDTPQGRTPLPTTVETPADYVSALVDEGKGSSAIEQTIATIHSCLATAAKHGIGFLHALAELVAGRL